MKMNLDLYPEPSPLLMAAVCEHLKEMGHVWVTDVLVEALRPYTKPPEPLGLGAVVETDTGEQWVRVWNHLIGGKVWTQGLSIGDGPAICRDYHSIPATRVLTEGVGINATP